MASTPRVRSALVRSLGRALIAVAVAGTLLIVIEFALLPVSGPIWYVYALLPAVPLVYLCAGLLAWRRRPSNPMGALILFMGLAVYLGTLGNTSVPTLQAIGAILQTLPLAVMMHLLLAFPGGRLQSRVERVMVIVAYVDVTVVFAPQYLLSRSGPYPPFAVVDLPALAADALLVQGGIGSVLMLMVAVILFGRLRHADSVHRRVLIPLFAYGIFALLFVPFSSFVLVRLLGVSDVMRGILQFLVIAGVPVAFVLGILRGGFARTGELEELSTWLGAATVTKEPLGTALARALGDPSLALVFWADDRGRFVDAGGHPVEAPAATADHGVEAIALDGRTIGAISYDARLLTDPELVRTAGNVVAIAVERERLTAELLASSRALVRSRERIVEAADKERRRIARDLHDGLQVQLVMLGLEAQRIASAPPDAVDERATRLRRDIDAAAADLRSLVHQLVPAALIERGLFAAAEDLVDRMPVPTELEAADHAAAHGPLGEVVENTAYFVVAEGLTNVVKHARAQSARVRIARVGDVQHVEVHDDGAGGAALERGSGLRGLADRVDAAGGTLTLTSVAGEGTHLWAQLRCAS